MEERSKKIPLVLLSGGLDSTLALAETLKESTCDVIYIAGRQGPRKVMCEKNAVKNILGYLNALVEDPNNPTAIRHKVNHVSYKNLDNEDIMFRGGFQQVMYWIVGAMNHIANNQYNERYSSVVLSYLLDDQMATFHQTLELAWDNLGKICTTGLPPLSFPLLKMTKASVIGSYLDNPSMEELLKLTWTCELPHTPEELKALQAGEPIPDRTSVENPEFVACGVCVACEHQQSGYRHHENAKVFNRVFITANRWP